MTVEVPMWLATWQRANHPQAAAQGVQQRSPGSQAANTTRTRRRAVAPAAQSSDLYGFSEPQPWQWDGGKRREAVLDNDHNPPRVVRHVGWRICLRCSDPFWSHDLRRLRMCSACKSPRKSAGESA